MCSASSLPGQSLGHLITHPEITSYVEVGMRIFKLKKKKKPPSTKGSSPEEREGNPSLPECPRRVGGFSLPRRTSSAWPLVNPVGFLCLICLRGGADKSIKTVQVGLCRGLPHHNTERCTLLFTRGLSLPAPLPSKEVPPAILKGGKGKWK